jgi:zinc transport system ATP-binding protein
VSASPALSFDRVSLVIAGASVLDEVTLEVAPGEFLAIVGPNGGGKSTLVRVALGLVPPTAGTVRLLGLPPRAASRRVGYVPQFAGFPRDFPITVREAVRQGRLGVQAWWRPLGRADRTAAERALDAVGLLPLGDRPIAALSGGELQRVLIARALAADPEVLILDEPTAHVDAGAEQDLFSRLGRERASRTIVMVSHDLGFVSGHASRIACLDRRLLCAVPPPLAPDVLGALYGARMQTGAAP